MDFSSEIIERIILATLATINISAESLEKIVDVSIELCPRLPQPSVKPPPLVLSRSFKAEILSQTVQEGHIQSRSVGRAVSRFVDDGQGGRGGGLTAYLCLFAEVFLMLDRSFKVLSVPPATYL